MKGKIWGFLKVMMKSNCIHDFFQISPIFFLFLRDYDLGEWGGKLVKFFKI